MLHAHAQNFAQQDMLSGAQHWHSKLNGCMRMRKPCSAGHTFRGAQHWYTKYNGSMRMHRLCLEAHAYDDIYLQHLPKPSAKCCVARMDCQQ